MEPLIITVLAAIVLAAFVGFGWVGWKLMLLVDNERRAHREAQTELVEKFEAFARNGQEEIRGMMGEWRVSVEDLTTKIKAGSLEDAARYRVATAPEPPMMGPAPMPADFRRQQTMTPEDLERASVDPSFLEMLEKQQH